MTIEALEEVAVVSWILKVALAGSDPLSEARELAW